MDNSLLLSEVIELTLAYQAGAATDEEFARLERLLLDHPEAVDVYLRVVADTLALRETATLVAAGEPEDTHFAGDAVDSWSTSYWAPQKRIRRSGVWAIGVCAVVLIAAGSWLWWSEGSSVASLSADDVAQSARVVSTANVQWADGAEVFQDWSFVTPGSRLAFRCGVLNLYLTNGVELLVEGPADVDFVSLRKVVARKGKLAARVGPGAVGFKIETPHAQVIDRGTSFGVSVDEGSRTSIVVYEGMVDLDVLGGAEHPRRRLASGEALSVDQAGRLSRITTVQTADFLAPPRFRSVGAVPAPVIASVSDNVQSLQTTKFYRIIRGGFQEDCRAYVDRQHEWNSVDGRGLPPFLLGGDYVMTFNDDKITTEIEIAVSLSQPASVYVLIDDRVAPPEWLTRDFVDTNWDVGSDEGYDGRDIQIAVGAGTSIDHVCSVWRRNVSQPTTVILGALSYEESQAPARDVERSMYGIVATPLGGK